MMSKKQERKKNHAETVELGKGTVKSGDGKITVTLDGKLLVNGS